jgi:peptidoglycan/xylan/chitin deacetylase (PgdA/CDA1 family)
MPAGTLVLLYHRVARLDRDPYGLAVRPDRFAQQCSVLRQHCDVVPLGDANGGPRQVAITFDDGYADNGGAAREILTKAGLPATFFITEARLGQRAEVWWDRLEHTLFDCEPLPHHVEVDIGGSRFWGDIRSRTARARVHQALYRRLQRLRPSTIESILTGIETQLGVERDDRETHRWMTRDELRALATTAGVDVGAHTLTHPFLAALPREEQWQEINGSRVHLERLLQTRISAFSYPYGGHEAFDAVTTQLVREAGYTLACTSGGGLAHANHHPYTIPRNVVGDWDAATFAQWLERSLAS